MYLWGQKQTCRCTAYRHVLNPLCCVETFHSSLGEYINLFQRPSREGNLQYLHANNSLQCYSPLCDSADCQAVKAWHFLFIHQVTYSHGNHWDRHIHPPWQDGLYMRLWSCLVWGSLAMWRKGKHPADVNPWCSYCVVSVFQTGSYFRVFLIWLISLNWAETYCALQESPPLIT